jgi:hypothetical protein
MTERVDLAAEIAQQPSSPTVFWFAGGGALYTKGLAPYVEVKLGSFEEAR